MTGLGVPGVLDERDPEFFRRTRKVSESEEAHATVVEAMWPLFGGSRRMEMFTERKYVMWTSILLRL